MRRTNFALGSLIATEENASSVGIQTAGQKISSIRPPRLYCLHGEILPHGIRDAIAIFARLDALLGQELYLRSPNSCQQSRA